MIAATDVRIPVNPPSKSDGLLNFRSEIFVNRLFEPQTGHTVVRVRGHQGSDSVSVSHPPLKPLPDPIPLKIQSPISRWERFVGYTHRQIMELMSGYGPIDLLWLDGGWVRPRASESTVTRPGFWRNRAVSQDVRLGEVVARARTQQPGLIVVDRGVPGVNQDYLTPENRVPAGPLPHPWEMCKTTTGESWSWAPDEKCMTGAEAIRLLVDVVTKGGNLLLNIGPGPDGRWPEDAHRLLAEIGTWMKHNGEGIYATRTVPGWSLGPVRLVRQRHTGVHYLHALEAPSKTDGASSMRLDLPGTTLSESGSIRLLGSDAPLAVRRTSEGLYIDLPPSVRVNGVHWPVCVLRIEGLSVQSKPEVAP